MSGLDTSKIRLPGSKPPSKLVPQTATAATERSDNHFMHSSGGNSNVNDIEKVMLPTPENKNEHNSDPSQTTQETLLSRATVQGRTRRAPTKKGFQSTSTDPNSQPSPTMESTTATHTSSLAVHDTTSLTSALQDPRNLHSAARTAQQSSTSVAEGNNTDDILKSTWDTLGATAMASWTPTTSADQAANLWSQSQRTNRQAKTEISDPGNGSSAPSLSNLNSGASMSDSKGGGFIGSMPTVIGSMIRPVDDVTASKPNAPANRANSTLFDDVFPVSNPAPSQHTVVNPQASVSKGSDLLGQAGTAPPPTVGFATRLWSDATQVMATSVATSGGAPTGGGTTFGSGVTSGSGTSPQSFFSSMHSLSTKSSGNEGTIPSNTPSALLSEPLKNTTFNNNTISNSNSNSKEKLLVKSLFQDDDDDDDDDDMMRSLIKNQSPRKDTIMPSFPTKKTSLFTDDDEDDDRFLASVKKVGVPSSSTSTKRDLKGLFDD